LELDSDEELTRDGIFHILQCRRRRLVLKYLCEYDGEEPIGMSDIAEHIAALEHDTTVDGLRSQQRQRVYIPLYQSHLPKMDDAGIIEYNQDRGLVETTDRTHELQPYLDGEPRILPGETEERASRAQDTEDVDTTESSMKPELNWHKYNLYAASATFVALVAASTTGMSLPTPAGTSLGIVVSALFLLLAAGHWLTESSAVEDDLFVENARKKQ
jgi:hypothetical protein